MWWIILGVWLLAGVIGARMYLIDTYHDEVNAPSWAWLQLALGVVGVLLALGIVDRNTRRAAIFLPPVDNPDKSNFINTLFGVREPKPTPEALDERIRKAEIEAGIR